MSEHKTLFSTRFTISHSSIVTTFLEDDGSTSNQPEVFIQIEFTDQNYLFSVGLDKFKQNLSIPKSYSSGIDGDCVLCGTNTFLVPIGGYEYQNVVTVDRNNLDARAVLVCSDCKSTLDNAIEELITENSHQFLAQYI